MSTTPATPTVLETANGHVHVAELDTCLAFINTLELDASPQDHLTGPDDGVAWLATRSLAHEASLRAQAGTGAAADAWLDGVRSVRAALRETWDAVVEGRTVGARALDTLNDVLEHAAHAELRAGPAGVVVDHRHDPDPTSEALALLAEPLVAAILEGDTGRFRICANDVCRWVFEDTSRGGRRRWCDMTSCGNRAKVRRYRSRHAATDAGPLEAASDAAAADG